MTTEPFTQALRTAQKEGRRPLRWRMSHATLREMQRGFLTDQNYVVVKPDGTLPPYTMFGLEIEVNPEHKLPDSGWDLQTTEPRP